MVRLSRGKYGYIELTQVEGREFGDSRFSLSQPGAENGEEPFRLAELAYLSGLEGFLWKAMTGACEHGRVEMPMAPVAPSTKRDGQSPVSRTTDWKN